MMTYDFSKTPAPYDFSKHSVVKAWDEMARRINDHAAVMVSDELARNIARDGAFRSYGE